MKKIPLILACLLVLCCVPEVRAADQGTAQGQAEAGVGNALATADANGGYSGQVLALISRVWTPPPDTINRRVAVRLKIDGEGNLAQCDLMTRSDMPEMNKAACFAAKEAGNFGVPPYGMPIDVYVTFWTGKPTKNTRGGKPVEDAEKPATSKVDPKPEPKGVVIKPEVTTPTHQPEPKGVVIKPETASPKQEARQEVRQEPKPAPKGVPVLPAKADTKTPAPAKVETPAKLAAPAKSEVQTKPESKAEHRPENRPENRPAPKPKGKPAVSRGGLAGDNDAATTPIKSSSNKAATTPSKAEAPKKEAPKEAAKKEAPAKEAGKKEAAPKDAKKDSAKAAKPGVRTDFAPYRDPKAKPEVEKPAQPSADQRRYAAEMTAWIQARIVPPEKVPSGKYTMNVTVAVAGTGDIGEAVLSRSSGQAVLDEAVLRTVLRMEKVPPPPDKQSRDMKLTLTVHKP